MAAKHNNYELMLFSVPEVHITYNMLRNVSNILDIFSAKLVYLFKEQRLS